MGRFNCINTLYYIIYIFRLFSSKGQLKEKKGKWKFLKRWKTRYFTLSGAHMTYNKSDHVSKLYCSCTSNGGYSSSSASLECLDIGINSFGWCTTLKNFRIFFFFYNFFSTINCIGGVIVFLLIFSVEDPGSYQVKPFSV